MACALNGLKTVVLDPYFMVSFFRLILSVLLSACKDHAVPSLNDFYDYVFLLDSLRSDTRFVSVTDIFVVFCIVKAGNGRLI